MNIETTEKAATRTALLMIDFQIDFLRADGRFPVAQDQAVEIIEVANRLLEVVPSCGIEVIYIGNEFTRQAFVLNLFRNFAAMRGSAGAKLDERVKKINGVYFPKNQENAFSNPALNQYLSKQQLKELVLVGVKAEACIKGTARGALAHGYKVRVLSDGVATNSSKKRERALQTMQRQGVEILPSSDFLSNLTALQSVGR